MMPVPQLNHQEDIKPDNGVFYPQIVNQLLQQMHKYSPNTSFYKQTFFFLTHYHSVLTCYRKFLLISAPNTTET